MGLPSVVEEYKIVQALAPATDAAGRTGAYVSLKHAHRAFIVVHITQGNAATIALTIEQATNVAGAGSKVITVPVQIWSNLNTATNDTLVRRPDAVNQTTDAGLANKIVVFQIDPATLDLAGGFDCITIRTGASNAANLTQAMYLLSTRYKQATPPTAVID